MSKNKRTWSKEEKLEIVNYYKQNGIAKTKRTYGVSMTSVYKWEKAYDQNGFSGLSTKKDKSINSELEDLRRLRRENESLKKIVAEKELALRIKEELLKKSR